MAEIRSKIRRAWAMAALAGGVATAATVLHHSSKDTKAVFVGSGAATSQVVKASSAYVTSSLLGTSSTLSTTLLASSLSTSPAASSTTSTTSTSSTSVATTIAATTTAATVTVPVPGLSDRPEKGDSASVEAAATTAGRRPSSVSEIQSYHGKELADAVEASVEPYKAPPADGSGIPLPPAPLGTVCAVRATRPSDGLDPFYAKICVASGVPVVASAQVDDRALVAAADIVAHMLDPRPDLRNRLIKNHLRVGVIGLRENALMMPEYRDLATIFPNDDWSSRAYSATLKRPLVAVPEENLLCWSNDSYPGQSVLTHEMGHSVVDLAVREADGSFWPRVEDAYRKAMAAGRFKKSYAATNAAEYWAEGVQDFFDASTVYAGPNGEGNGYDSPIGNRADLASYDPVLYQLIRDVFTDSPWRPHCPS